jgi:polysaccharide pyruvyl transferase WcaK-like protein
MNTGMSVLKIGVLTFHRCINYGSYWQARCLAEGLQAKGHNAVILDHYSLRINIAEWKCAYQPVLPTAVPKSDHPLYRKKIEKFFKAFDRLPLSSRFHLDNPEEMEYCDIVVVGSDEVWNLFHPWYGNNPVFYGEGIRTERLISYAASFGNYPASWGIDQHWSSKLRNFEEISVRDENSYWIIKNAIGIEPEIVLDPCLQFSVHPEERDSSYWQKPYIAVYGHNFSSSYIRAIKDWADHKQLPLISIGYRNDWADQQWLTADPHDFAHFIRNSEAVATNFFHGCVFALRSFKPFVCESSQYRSNKVQGLMNKIGGHKHLLSEDATFSDLNHILSEPIDLKIIHNIDRLRQTSDEYLDRALELNQLQYA